MYDTKEYAVTDIFTLNPDLSMRAKLIADFQAGYWYQTMFDTLTNDCEVGNSEAEAACNEVFH